MNRHSGTYKGDREEKEEQVILLQTFTRPKYACSKARTKGITNHIANFVFQNMKPMCVIEGQGFIKLMAYQEPVYQTAKSNVHYLNLKQKHNLGKNNFQERLNEVISLAFITAICMSIATEVYITILRGILLLRSLDL